MTVRLCIGQREFWGIAFFSGYSVVITLIERVYIDTQSLNENN